MNVRKIDGTIGNRSFQDTKDELIDMGVDKGTLQEIEFYSHLHREDGETNADLVADYYGSLIGLECKGIAPSKIDDKSNFKYWGKGILDQMMDIDDTFDCDRVGIAIPESCTDILRGILSSNHSKIDAETAKQKCPEDLYGVRKAEKLELCRDDDLLFVVRTDGIKTTDCRTFFGL